MTPQLEHTIELFYNYIYGNISLQQFEQSLEQDDSIRQILGAQDLAFDFSQQSSEDSLRFYLRQVADRLAPGALTMKRVKDLLNDMLQEKLDLVLGCMELSDLHSSGVSYIPSEFQGFWSELDDIPLPAQYYLWNSEALKEKLQRINLYKSDILEACQKLLNNLS